MIKGLVLKYKNSLKIHCNIVTGMLPRKNFENIKSKLGFRTGEPDSDSVLISDTCGSAAALPTPPCGAARCRILGNGAGQKACHDGRTPAKFWGGILPVFFVA